MFEKANTAYEFLCSRAAKASDAPDADNIVLILRAQSILFSRYSTELGSTLQNMRLNMLPFLGRSFSYLSSLATAHQF